MATFNDDEELGFGSDTTSTDAVGYEGTVGIESRSIVVPFAADATPPTGGTPTTTSLDPSDPEFGEGGGKM